MSDEKPMSSFDVQSIVYKALDTITSHFEQLSREHRRVVLYKLEQITAELRESINEK